MSSTRLVYNRVSTLDTSKLVLPMPNLSKETSQNLLFLIIVFLGCMISVYDNVLNVVYGDQLIDNEQNPVATWIIMIMGVSGFVAFKACTTMLACLIGIRVVYTKYRVALVFVLMVMSLLFYYLSFYEPIDYTSEIDNPPLMEAIRFYLD